MNRPRRGRRFVVSEQFETLGQARQRENQIKRWTRAKKEALIRGDNSELHRIHSGEVDSMLKDIVAQQTSMGALRAVGCVPEGLYVITVPVSRAHAFFGGKMLEPSDVLIVPPNGEIDLAVLSKFEYLMAAVPEDVFSDQTCHTWGRPFTKAGSTRRYRQISPEGRRGLLSIWKDRLRQAIDHPERLHDPQYI